MFITQLLLNSCNAQVRQELAHPYEMHRTISRGFAEGTLGVPRSLAGAAGLMFRVENRPDRVGIPVLVQSKAQPDWTYLDDIRDRHGQPYLLPDSMIPDGRPNPETTILDFSNRITAGQTLAFRLRANPTKRAGNSDMEHKGKRIGLEDEEQQRAWLGRKAETGGFRIVRLLITQEQAVRDTLHRGMPGERQTHELSLVAVRFDGLLEVIDPKVLARTVEAGIGSGKGLGFGLLSLAPAPRS